MLTFLVGMDKSKLSDEEWVQLVAGLKKTPGIRIGCEATCRRFVEAVLWMLRSDAQWRLLPNRLGHWNSVFKRFISWSRFDVWENMLAHISPRLTWKTSASTAPWCGLTPVPLTLPTVMPQQRHWDAPAGFFSCKLHALTDALGLPMRLILTAGQAADITQAIASHEEHWLHGRTLG